MYESIYVEIMIIPRVKKEADFVLKKVRGPKIIFWRCDSHTAWRKLIFIENCCFCKRIKPKIICNPDLIFRLAEQLLTLTLYKALPLCHLEEMCRLDLIFLPALLVGTWEYLHLNGWPNFYTAPDWMVSGYNPGSFVSIVHVVFEKLVYEFVPRKSIKIWISFVGNCMNHELYHCAMKY